MKSIFRFPRLPHPLQTAIAIAVTLCIPIAAAEDPFAFPEIPSSDDVPALAAPFGRQPAEDRGNERAAIDDERAAVPGAGNLNGMSDDTAKAESASEDAGIQMQHPPYRRPSLDDPLFDPLDLTLDIDQAGELADLLAALTRDFPDQPVTFDPEFQAHTLGIALRLDPRNLAAVVANSRLDEGVRPDPLGISMTYEEVFRLLMIYADLMTSRSDATAADRVLGAYLAAIATRMPAPGDDSLQVYSRLAESAAAVDWSPVLPPPILPDPEPAPDTGLAEEDTPDRDREEVEFGPAVADAETRPPVDAIRLSGRIDEPTTTTRTVVLSGGVDSRAGWRTVSLRARDHELRPSYADGRVTMEQTNNPIRGRTELVFDRSYGGTLRNRWNDVERQVFRRRFENWPEGYAIDVRIPHFRPNSGSSALIAVAVATEAMVRGERVDPEVAFVGTWNERGNLISHTHLPGIVLLYGNEWSPVLITPPGRALDLETIAGYGIAQPFLITQIIELATYEEIADFAFGRICPNLQDAMERFKEIMGLRRRMDAREIAANRAVRERLESIVTDAPNHISARMLLHAGEAVAQPLTPRQTHEIVSRLYSSLEQLAENDLAWVSEREGLDSIEVFGERLRELGPRLDPGVRRLELRFNDATNAIREALRMRDRTTGTAARRIEQARQAVIEGRAAINAEFGL